MALRARTGLRASSGASADGRSGISRVALSAIVIAGCGLRVVGSHPLEPGDDAGADDSYADVRVSPDSSLPVDSSDGAFDSGAVLTVTRLETPALVDLSAEGTRDWAHWGYGSQRNEMISGDGIGEYEISPASLVREYASNTSVSFKWTGGTPTAEQAGTNTYSYLNDVDGIVATVPVDASTTKRTARLYLGGKGSRVRFEFSLTDGSAPPPPPIEVEDAANSFLTTFVVVFAAATTTAKLQAKCTLLRRFTTDASVRVAAVTLKDGVE